MKNKIKRNVFISLIIVISAIILIFISSPLIRSEKYIRNDILEKTPVGTSMDNVNNFNSNSFMHALLNAADIDTSKPHKIVPGWKEHALPESMFGQ